MLTVVLILTVVIILVIVALSTLFADALRGALGGRRTLERARRLLIVSSDQHTEAAAREWLRRFSATHPQTRCESVRISEPTPGEAYLAVQAEIERIKPDGVVWSLREGERHSEEGPYAMAKRELDTPMDAIYAADGTAEVDN